jgi:hypothetical protein
VTLPSIKLQPHQRELVEVTLEDLRHLAKESVPECDDHQLRRVSVELRKLLIDDNLVRSWKLLHLLPKAPIIIAPRLRTVGLGPNDCAVAGGGTLPGVTIGNFRIRTRTRSAEEIKAEHEQGRGDIEHSFRLSNYKESCAIYMRGQKASRRQLVQYVANKKGGAHLDNTRKKDEAAYALLDAAVENGFWFGPTGKNAVYLELLSIGQNLTSSPDVRRFMNDAQMHLAS